jgi:hypothetical protein
MVYVLSLIVMLSTGICYVVAKRKSLNVQLWLCLGVLFGPFALPFLLLARSRAAKLKH